MNLGKETEKLEFKESTKELEKALDDICAILNKCNEGTLFFGVKDDGEVIGFSVGKNTESEIFNKIRNSIEPRIYPTIEHLTIEDKEVIKVDFKGDSTPYSSNGRYFIRVSDSSTLMNREILFNYIRKASYSANWELEETPYTLDDIDDEALYSFYKDATEANRLEFKEYDKEKLLRYLGLYNGMLNKAGYYLFGKNVNINLKLTMYATTDKTTNIDLKMVRGNIFNLVDEALKYIYQNIKWRAIITSTKRKDVPEIPEEAIREIVVNSFAHAQYESNTEHEISFYRDRIEIYNPGAFPMNLTPKNFIFENRSSIIRNKIIADVLFRSKYVEKGGSGFQKVNKLCSEFENQWNYKLSDEGFTFVFFKHGYYFDGLLKENITFIEFDPITKAIFEIIKENPTIKKSEIAIRINKSEKTVQRAISFLVNSFYIVRIGNYKKGYWKIVERNGWN